MTREESTYQIQLATGRATSKQLSCRVENAVERPKAMKGLNREIAFEILGLFKERGQQLDASGEMGALNFEDLVILGQGGDVVDAVHRVLKQVMEILMEVLRSEGRVQEVGCSMNLCFYHGNTHHSTLFPTLLACLPLCSTASCSALFL